MHSPPLVDVATVTALPERYAPYWNTLEYCRHLGIEKQAGRPLHWMARVRCANGKYCQKRLGMVSANGPCEGEFQAAVEKARAWFGDPGVQAVSSVPYSVGVNQSLRYTKLTSGFTIGDALRDYEEWKRVAAAQSHFDTVLSLINFHIIPRIGDVLLSEFNNRQFTAFCVDVLESSPKRGNQAQGSRVILEDIPQEALRKRKKTLNALISILRLGLRIALENGETESERSWRCLRRVPRVDIPRQIFLTRPECRTLLQHCRADLANLVRGALYSGCRVSELARLKVGDVGTHIFGLDIAPRKSYRWRHVYLPDEGMAFFLSLCAERQPDEPVFLMQSRRLWDSNHKHLFRAAVRDAGLPEGFVFHGLRHAYASQLVQAGTPLAIVARQLGHANTDTVSRTYGHLSCDTIEGELSRRFARLEVGAGADNAGAQILRQSLQVRISGADQPSFWPRSNHSTLSGHLAKRLRPSFHPRAD